MQNDGAYELTVASSTAAKNLGQPRLLDEVRNRFRLLPSSKRNEEALGCVSWTHVDCASRTSISNANRLSFDKERATKIDAFRSLKKIIPKLKAQIERVVKLHETDLESGAGWVRLPYALADKYPEAGRTFAWQFVFPAPNISRDSYPRLPTEGESGSEQVSKNDLTQLSRTTIRLVVSGSTSIFRF